MTFLALEKKSTMEQAFEKNFFLSIKLDYMQHFLKFTNKDHELAQCEHEECDIGKFIKKLEEKFLRKSYIMMREGFILLLFVLQTCPLLMLCSVYIPKEKKI